MTEDMPKSIRKRRWLRFSLRTFLIVVTLFCVWLAWYVYRVERQKSAVRWVRENPGRVYYSYEIDEKGNPEDGLQPPVFRWLIDILGTDYFCTVEWAELSYRNINDATPLSSLVNLKYLDLTGTQIGDLTPLKNLKKLEHLILDETNISDLSPLADLKNLRCLSVKNTMVNDFSTIGSLTNLESLTLEGTQIDDATPLAKLTNLEMLDIRYTYINDIGPLVSLTKLKHLRMTYSESQDTRLLKSLTQLKELYVYGWFTNADIDELRKALPNCKINKW